MLAVCLVASVSMSIKHPVPPAMWPVSASLPLLSHHDHWECHNHQLGEDQQEAALGEDP